MDGGEDMETLPLYRRYPGQSNPQDAFIEIDLETGKVGTAIAEPGDAVPAHVRLGLVRRVPVNPLTLGGALERFLASKRVKKLVRRVVRGSRVYWDGVNRIAELNGDAEKALEVLEALASELPRGVVREPEEALDLMYFRGPGGLHYIDEDLITHENLELLCLEFPEVYVDDDVWYFVPGLHDLLRKMAEENAAHLKDLQEE